MVNVPQYLNIYVYKCSYDTNGFAYVITCKVHTYVRTLLKYEILKVLPATPAKCA